MNLESFIRSLRREINLTSLMVQWFMYAQYLTDRVTHVDNEIDHEGSSIVDNRRNV